MNNKNLLGLLASLLPITIVVGCKGEKASAAECVKDSVVSLSIDNDSVIKRRTYLWSLIPLVSRIVRIRVLLILLIPFLWRALMCWSIRYVLTSRLR